MNIPISKILEYGHPMLDGCWQTGKVYPWMVHKRVREKRTYDYETWKEIPSFCDVSSWIHAGRIAYLVLHGWTDPILIDVGCRDEWCGDWIVWDGNHRLSAAWFMGKDLIDVEFSGSEDLIESLFGISFL